eukprot:scaffold287582_cov39-Prasinocladus_malaysianus.AAC.1
MACSSAIEPRSLRSLVSLHPRGSLSVVEGKDPSRGRATATFLAGECLALAARALLLPGRPEAADTTRCWFCVPPLGLAPGFRVAVDGLATGRADAGLETLLPGETAAEMKGFCEGVRLAGLVALGSRAGPGGRVVVPWLVPGADGTVLGFLPGCGDLFTIALELEGLCVNDAGEGAWSLPCSSVVLALQTLGCGICLRGVGDDNSFVLSVACCLDGNARSAL